MLIYGCKNDGKIDPGKNENVIKINHLLKTKRKENLYWRENVYTYFISFLINELGEKKHMLVVNLLTSLFLSYSKSVKYLLIN